MILNIQSIKAGCDAAHRYINSREFEEDFGTPCEECANVAQWWFELPLEEINGYVDCTPEDPEARTEYLTAFQMTVWNKLFDLTASMVRTTTDEDAN